MRSLVVRTVCLVVNFLLGDTGWPHRERAELDRTVARARDAYFDAFRGRCMQWVYGDDPRRSLERERSSS